MRTPALAIATAAAVLGVLAPAATANPWPQDGQNVFNFRSHKTEGPAASRAANPTKVYQRSVNSAVTGTPIVSASKVVYVGTWAGTVYAFARDSGQLLRARAVGAGPIPGSLLLANGTLFAVVSQQGGPYLVALDPVTLESKWTDPVTGADRGVRLDTQPLADAWASPNYSVEHNLVYVPICACKAEHDGRAPSIRGAVVAVDATTGDIRWKTHTVGVGRNGGAVAGTPAVYDAVDRLYVGTGRTYTGAGDPGANALLALDTATGTILGSFQANGSFTTGTNAFVNSVTRKAHVGAGARDGVYYAVDPITMQKVWSAGPGAPSPGGGIRSTAAWDQVDSIFGATNTPSLYFRVKTAGSLAWAFPGTELAHTGPVSVSRGVVWSTDTAGFLDAHDTGTGRPLGRIALGEPSTGGVSFAGARVFVGVGVPNGTTGSVASFK